MYALAILFPSSSCLLPPYPIRIKTVIHSTPTYSGFSPLKFPLLLYKKLHDPADVSLDLSSSRTRLVLIVFIPIFFRILFFFCIFMFSWVLS